MEKESREKGKRFGIRFDKMTQGDIRFLQIQSHEIYTGEDEKAGMKKDDTR